MDTKPILIGEAPEKDARSDCPLYPYPPQSSGGKLYSMSPFTNRKAFIKSCYRLNLLAEYPGDGDKLWTWPKERARHCAMNLKGSGLVSDRRVVLVGAKVASAFDLPLGFGPDTINVLQWYEWPFGGYSKDFTVAIMPHPSGLNRWYNDPVNRMRTEEFLRELFS